VLLTDDEDYPREAFSELLKSWGAEVRTCASVAEPLLIFLDFKPHVIMSDIGMPSEDGYSLIRKIRSLSQEQGRDVLAVALTAYASGEDVDKAHSAGFQVHLGKPVDSGDLARVMIGLVDVLVR
jgi:CheY-like chemotaxis protein